MASSTLILAGVQPVETSEVVQAVAALLLAYAPFVVHITRNVSGRAGALHVHRLPVSKAGTGPADARTEAEAEAVPLYALVREMAFAGATTTRETPDGLVTVPVQLQLSVDPASAANPDGVLSRGHVLAWRALQGALVAGDEGEGAFASTACIDRDGVPSPARSDSNGRLYSSAYFQVPVQPVASSQPAP